MQNLFNISENFSQSLDEVRGPARKNHYLKRARAWIKPSSARRSAAKILGYGGPGLVIALLGVVWLRNRQFFVAKRKVPEGAGTAPERLAG